MCIDLAKNCLRIGTEEISFLAEHEIPEKAKTMGKVPESPNKSGPSTANPITPLSAPKAANPPTNASKYPEAAIKTLTDLGVGRDEALGALEVTIFLVITYK